MVFEYKIRLVIANRQAYYFSLKIITAKQIIFSSSI